VKALVNSDNPLGGVDLFAVIGAQRTGTNLLREILNTNEQIAMLGEVFRPHPAPAHWDNFCRSLPVDKALPASVNGTGSLLDQYFAFVRYRIRNHWEGNIKISSHAFGIDIKYNQLRDIAPAHWNSSHPFILSYLRSRGATLIHITRNVVHSAISTLIAAERNVWHNYDGIMIDRSYRIDVEECMVRARRTLNERNAFIESARGGKLVSCSYENLIEDVDRAGFNDEIPEGPGPLKDIANALGSHFNFRYDRRLQKAINVPYSTLLSNFDDLIARLKYSEFSALVSTLS